jgi:hypothetical protein
MVEVDEQRLAIRIHPIIKNEYIEIESSASIETASRFNEIDYEN